MVICSPPAIFFFIYRYTNYSVRVRAGLAVVPSYLTGPWFFVEHAFLANFNFLKMGHDLSLGGRHESSAMLVSAPQQPHNPIFLFGSLLGSKQMLG